MNKSIFFRIVDALVMLVSVVTALLSSSWLSGQLSVQDANVLRVSTALVIYAILSLALTLLGMSSTVRSFWDERAVFIGYYLSRHEGSQSGTYGILKISRSVISGSYQLRGTTIKVGAAHNPVGSWNSMSLHIDIEGNRVVYVYSGRGDDLPRGEGAQDKPLGLAVIDFDGEDPTSGTGHFRDDIDGALRVDSRYRRISRGDIRKYCGGLSWSLFRTDKKINFVTEYHADQVEGEGAN